MRKVYRLIGVASLAIAGFVGSLTVSGCGSTTQTVDGKVELRVPGTDVPCYLLEIDTDSAGGEEMAEGYHCVEKAEWDRNRVGEEWVDKNGSKR